MFQNTVVIRVCVPGAAPFGGGVMGRRKLGEAAISMVVSIPPATTLRRGYPGSQSWRDCKGTEPVAHRGGLTGGLYSRIDLNVVRHDRLAHRLVDFVFDKVVPPVQGLGHDHAQQFMFGLGLHEGGELVQAFLQQR